MTMLDIRSHVAKETKETLLGLEMGSPQHTHSDIAPSDYYLDVCRIGCLMNASQKIRMSENESMNGLFLRMISSSDAVCCPKSGKKL